MSSGAQFDLTTGAPRPEFWTSADAAGLPMLPLLVRYDEAARGEIKHPFRVSISPGLSRNRLRALALTGSAGAHRLSLNADYAITVSVTVDPAHAGGTISNTATVTADENDPNVGNDSATQDTTVTPPPSADVSLTRQVEMIVGKTVEMYGRLDCAFNNAGIEGEFRSAFTLGSTSRTGVLLARMLLEQRYGVHARFFDSAPDLTSMLLEAAAGVLIGVVGFDILPEIFDLVREQRLDAGPAMIALVTGFLVFHAMEKLVLIHHAQEGAYAGHHHPAQPRVHDPATTQVTMALPKAAMPLFNFMQTRRGQHIDGRLVKTTGHSLFSFLFSRNMGRPYRPPNRHLEYVSDA